MISPELVKSLRENDALCKIIQNHVGLNLYSGPLPSLTSPINYATYEMLKISIALADHPFFILRVLSNHITSGYLLHMQ